ncbi:MAG: YggS family pyridoxal phosphate-dependent enzyme [Rhodospirillaceae bacterium]|jgi:PLP dependent protein|nr:YggS family pyridoxal phosphate-dependent enzyme [Rhodospirillaceae bacterium]MBT5458202.1 YggS family pyridoxal phosphate-dependent enzyme [Rhodospirillaceae bacterium]
MAETELRAAANEDIANRLSAITAEIESVRSQSPAAARSVTLVAVSKMHPQGAARAALEAGHRVFGENRVQEAQQKFPELRAAFPDLSLHLIGPLQTNKVREAVALFDVIETIDRPRLAAALAKEMARTDRHIDFMIQVNTGEEPQKAGVLPGEADAFIEQCRETYRLPVSGLMCIPPMDEEPAMHFALLAEMARRNGIDHLSMGMSADYEMAVRLGATHVRLGTAIFGARPPA